jgi:hypothetical protein
VLISGPGINIQYQLTYHHENEPVDQRRTAIPVFIIATNSFAQTPPRTGLNSISKQDGFYGVSSEKAYNELLKSRTVSR